MSFFIPTAATGNGLSLATFGRSGEIMSFCYPRLDFAQNVREGMPALRLADGSFLWCFADAWQTSQEFQPRSNLLITRLKHRHLPLRMTFRDVLPPGEPALLREVTIERGSPAGASAHRRFPVPDFGTESGQYPQSDIAHRKPEIPPAVQFMHYFRLAAGDSAARNAVQAYHRRNVVIQHFRDVSLAVSSSLPIEAICGAYPPPSAPPGAESHIKVRMHSGDFAPSPQTIGRVDFAVGFESTDAPVWRTVLVLAGGRTQEAAAETACRLAAVPFEEAAAAAETRCASILADAGPCPLPELTAGYERAVISLHDLYDLTEGTFIAAPEFDPGYALSGGYGYCWPRDAAHCALAMLRMGRREMADRFFDWAAKAQLPDGHWYQRYWTDGSAAPSWCVHADRIQLDQTCAMVHAAGLYARAISNHPSPISHSPPLPDSEISNLKSSNPNRKSETLDTPHGFTALNAPHRGESGEPGNRQSPQPSTPSPQPPPFIDAYRPTIARATEAILRHIGPDGLHLPAADLWENSEGTFTYSQAAVIAALREADEVFGIDPQRTGPAARQRLWEQLFERLWDPERDRWLRRITPDGHPDPTQDSSAMGLIEPWGILDLEQPDQRRLALQTLDGIDQDLRADARHGRAILRFEGESYMGGGPGCVNTLWMAVCRLRLAATATEPPEQGSQRTLALQEIAIALANTSPVGQLPELIPRTRFDYWAAPHGWASSLLIEAIHLLRSMPGLAAGPAGAPPRAAFEAERAQVRRRAPSH